MQRFLFAFLLVLISSSILLAQGTTGGLSGTVSGPDGVLPGATVVAIDNNTRRGPPRPRTHRDSTVSPNWSSGHTLLE